MTQYALGKTVFKRKKKDRFVKIRLTNSVIRHIHSIKMPYRNKSCKKNDKNHGAHLKFSGHTNGIYTGLAEKFVI